MLAAGPLPVRATGGLPLGAVSVLQDGGRLPWHQLFFDRMQLHRPEGPVRRYDRRGAPVKPPSAPAGRPAFRWVQPRLFEAWRDFTRFDEDADADPGNPWPAWGLYLAWQRGEARGWQRGLRLNVRRTLIIVLSPHQPGDAVRHSEIIPLQQAMDISARRVAEVLRRRRYPEPWAGIPRGARPAGLRGRTVRPAGQRRMTTEDMVRLALAAAAAMAVLLAAGCTAGRSHGAAAPPRSPGPLPAAPRTAAALLKIATTFNDDYQSGDYASVYARWDARSQALITQADYVRRNQECRTGPQPPASTEGAAPGPHGAWIVSYEIGGQQLSDYWFYVDRRWVFDLVLSNPDMVPMYQMTSQRYVAAMGCSH